MATTKYDKNWNTIGHVSDDGKVLYDKDWNVIGHVSDDGKTIHDKSGNVMGHLDDDRKTLYDKDWNTIGHLSNDGKTIFDKNWEVAERSDRPNRVAYVSPSPPSYRSSPREGNWVVWLIAAVIVLVVLYLIFVVVVPFVILNLSILALIGSFVVPRKKKALQWSSVAGLVYLIVDTQAHWLSHHLVKNIGVNQQVMDYIFYLNTVGGLTVAFLMLRVWLNSKYPTVAAPSDSGRGWKVLESRKRDIYAASGLVIAAAAMIFFYNRSLDRDIHSAVVSSFTNLVDTTPSAPQASAKLFTFNGVFQDAYLGDLYHLVFIDESNREWDFGQASSNNNLGTFELDLNGQGNPKYKGKRFLVTYDSIRTKVFAGETDEEGYMETVPRIVKLEMSE